VSRFIGGRVANEACKTPAIWPLIRARGRTITEAGTAVTRGKERSMSTGIEVHDERRQLLPFRESVLAMLGVASVSMLIALDQTVVGTAMPRIVAELKGFDLYAWVATAYMLASIITIPIFGRLGDLYGRKPFMLAAILVFTVASVLCGMANNMLFLVLARGLQGIGGGIMIGTVFATVADLFPDPRLRLRWLVFVSSAFAIANMIGPTLGGMLTQHGGWRLVFFVNVPVGAVAFILVRYFLPGLHHDREGGRLRLDWLGACVVAITFSALQLAIELVPRQGWTTWTITLAAIVLVCSLTLFFWEKRMGYPIIPVDMLLDRKLRALFAMSLLGGFAMFSLAFYVPLLFQGGYAMTPRASGMLITPLLLGTTVGSFVNNRVVTRIRRANAILYIGFALAGFASLAVVVLRGHEPHLVWMACMGASGLGLGLVGTSLTVCSQQIVSRSQIGAATALLQSLRTFGGMLGTVMTGALLGHLYAMGVHRSLDAYQETQWFKSFASPELLVDRAEQAALISRLVNAGQAGDAMMKSARGALVDSIHMGLTVAGLAALVGLCLAWFVPPVQVGDLGAQPQTR
jgi:EmrB/QacA subfamily drug resistance transporter